MVTTVLYQAASIRFWRWLLLFSIMAVCLLSHTDIAYAYGSTQCVGDRFGEDLVCTAGDVSITNIRILGDTTSCIGGNSVTTDLEVTVNFATPDRWDIGVFISNDGKDPKLTVANGGATSCAVAILPPSSPFLDLDGVPKGTTDTCGDGNKAINGGTGNGILYMPNISVQCQAISGSSGNLYIPYVVSWDNQASPVGLLCTSIADPVPNTKSKCNAPTVTQGTVSVVVLPTITKTDGITFIKSGNTTNYTVVITNRTGVTLSGAVFKDPAVTGINVTSLTCSAGGGATCPASYTIAEMQGAGITIPDMPVNSSVTFYITATLTGTPPDTRTNTATVTVRGQTNSATDTDTIVRDIAIIPTSSSKYGTPSTSVVFNYTLYNLTPSTDTISLSALSNQGWIVELSSSSITVLPNSSENFTVTVRIPSDADIGTVDTTTITATSGNNPSNTATATAVTTVSEPLTLTPDNIGSSGKGSSTFYEHRVQNNTALSQTITFSTSFSGSCTGWSKGVYKSDMVTQIPPASVTLSPFGGYEDIVVKVTIPSTATPGDICTVTVTATNELGNSASATDTTTVKDLILYSDPGYTKESYIFPTGNAVYARVFGTLATAYKFYWYDSSNTLKRTSPPYTGPGVLSDTYDPIPVAGPLGRWRVEVRQVSNNVLFAQSNFYVGPDHINASYTGANPAVNTNVTIDLSLHDRYNHVVPIDPATGNVVQGNPPTTKDPLKITVTVSGSAVIVSTTLSGAVIIGQTVTGRLDSITGTAQITITDSVVETVTITPDTYNSALYGSSLSPPNDRDESTTVTFVPIRRIRIVDWREIFY